MSIVLQALYFDSSVLRYVLLGFAAFDDISVIDITVFVDMPKPEIFAENPAEIDSHYWITAIEIPYLNIDFINILPKPFFCFRVEYKVNFDRFVIEAVAIGNASQDKEQHKCNDAEKRNKNKYFIYAWSCFYYNADKRRKRNEPADDGKYKTFVDNAFHPLHPFKVVFI